MGKEIFVGIDVSKTEIVVGLRPLEETRSFANTEKGIHTACRYLSPHTPALIVVEATGGYETLTTSILAAEGLPIVVVNPRQVRNFAKATGQLAKTDRIDALVIAWFAEAVRPKRTPLKDEETRRLTSLVTRRRQLIEMITAEQNRLVSAPQWVQKDISLHIDWLHHALEETDRNLRQFINNSPLWSEKDTILQSAPGIGPVISTILIAELPELGTLTAKQIAALVGVAPISRDSGAFRGKRMIWGGRASVRSALYMAVLVGIRSNPVIKAFYTRLITGGKASKVAMTACMHKLLLILNAMMKHQSSWRVRDECPSG